MAIISVVIGKIIDEREIDKKTKERQIKRKKSKGNKSYSKRLGAKWICCTFKLGFLQ